MNQLLHCALASLAGLALCTPALAQEKVLNLYSSRHYNTDEALYANFTKVTGIKINRIEAGEDPATSISRAGDAYSGRPASPTRSVVRLFRARPRHCL